ncbi:metalloregulator ArsR/SmtB family transcription factor [Aquimarina sp. 2201CG5-10]|uniref:ArsR/SmtB family transcription factor n=1 Tax=Aquimarina callyspongiae TaxID=3098150 RepID=UPI002AB4A066|nr:metalloregulator ArsR/SmtB family transcription factor [Aquimarina sp. 2201CG5-10]MDY8138540.1 metalloregulator ArsR/SmtB family transcription factor [Aquimarina sp. 2201CG5-10]
MITYIFVTNQLHINMRRDVFQAIADPIRRDIIELLANDTLTVNAIAENFEISRPAISKHLKILKECGIISLNKQGREQLCKIEPKSLIPAFLWMEQYQNLWEDKLDSFENYLMKLQAKNKNDE